MKVLAVIPCFNSSEKSYIINCVSKLKKSNPSFDIIIVDSDSQDKSYFEIVRSLGARILDVKNKHYDIGALETGINKYPDYDYYILIHDSLLISKSIFKYAQTYPVFVFRNFLCTAKIGGFKILNSRWSAFEWILNKFSNSKAKRDHVSGYGFDNQEQLKYFRDICNCIGLTIPEYWLGTFGPIFGISKEIALEMKELGIFKNKPTNKNEQMAFERIIGLYLNTKYGHNMGVVVGNHFEHSLNCSGIEKIIAFRK